MNKIKKIINIIVLIILTPILLVSVILIAKSYMHPSEVPDIAGYAPLIVLSGSMETEIYTGDLVIVKKVDISTLKKGDVIAFFTDESKETIVTHRIVDVFELDGKTRFLTKGDNNNSQDEGDVSVDWVVGKYQNIRFKGLGNAAMFLQTPTGIIIIISIPILILIISQFIQSRNDRKEIENLRKAKEEKDEKSGK